MGKIFKNKIFDIVGLKNEGLKRLFVIIYPLFVFFGIVINGLEEHYGLLGNLWIIFFYFVSPFVFLYFLNKIIIPLINWVIDGFRNN